MKRTILKYSLLNLLLLACSRELELPAPLPQEAVSFDAYLNRSVASKAGIPGELALAQLKSQGFGVFGYYTNDVVYSQAFVPNFMYNEKVTHNGATWTYAIPKYWPNEFGVNAESENVDRLSFFAYAPWVEIDATTGLSGDLTNGIIRVNRATDMGDPRVSYKSSFIPANCVDLCWGVANAPLPGTGTGDGANNVTVDEPFLNVARPASGASIQYNFKHALSALNVQIDANLDLADGLSRIYVRSIAFLGFAPDGQLNLNSKAGDPLWRNYDGYAAVPSLPVTIHDGRRDGREAVSAAPTEEPIGLNAAIVQNGLTTQPGVIATPVNLFDDASASKPVYVVPNGDILQVTIAYDVETADSNIMSQLLSDGTTHGSVVENVITAVVKDGSGQEIILEAGKVYTVKLHLGLNSVQFTAEVNETWENEGTTETNLPE